MPTVRPLIYSDVRKCGQSRRFELALRVTSAHASEDTEGVQGGMCWIEQLPPLVRDHSTTRLKILYITTTKSASPRLRGRHQMQLSAVGGRINGDYLQASEPLDSREYETQFRHWCVPLPSYMRLQCYKHLTQLTGGHASMTIGVYVVHALRLDQLSTCSLIISPRREYRCLSNSPRATMKSAQGDRCSRELLRLLGRSERVRLCGLCKVM